MTVFTDRMDVDVKISLYKYGFIRNPKTNKTVICTNVSDYQFGGEKPKVRIEYIDYFDILDIINEVGDEYFNFIGSTRQDEFDDLDNNYLTRDMHSLNAWDGVFNE